MSSSPCPVQIPRVEMTEQLLIELVTSRAQYKSLVTQHRDRQEAQELIDSIQHWLQQHQSIHYLWRPAIYALYRLMARHNLEPQSLMIPPQELQFERTAPSKIGTGARSTVYHGRWRRGLVAIKQVHVQDQAENTFLREVVTWSQLHHERILPLYGLARDPLDSASFLLVSPYQPLTLGEYVALAPGSDVGTATTPRGYCPRKHRDKLMRELAEGIAYLHARKIVHGDIKDSNILIDGDRSIKIADFGLSLVGDVTDERFKTTKSGSGSEGWKAPERVENSSSRREAPADVFAFACVCYMLITGHAPFQEWLRKGIFIDLFMGKNKRRSRPQDQMCLGNFTVSDQLWTLIIQCWRHRPQVRWTMQHVLAFFHGNTSMIYEPMEGGPLFATKFKKNYQAEYDDDLPGKAGDIVEIMECTTRTLRWQARNSRGMIGYVSPAHLEDPTVARVQTKVRFTAARPEELSFQKGECLSVFTFGKDEWMARNMKHQFGIVRPEHVGAPSWTGGQEEAIQVKAVADYSPNGYLFHLTFRAGQAMKLIRRPTNGSYFVAELDGTIGIVPSYMVSPR